MIDARKTPLPNLGHLSTTLHTQESTSNPYSKRVPDLLKMEPEKDWQTVSARKRAANLDQIPMEWRLPEAMTAKCTEDSTISVMDVPSTCGLLSEKEIEITQKYDATALLEQIASGR